MSVTLKTPSAGSVKRLEEPERTAPLAATQVARTRTSPRFAGTFGSTHTPLASTGAVRLRALTMQLLSSCARTGNASAVPARTVIALADSHLACRRRPSDALKDLHPAPRIRCHALMDRLASGSLDR